MAILVHAWKTGKQTKFRLFDTVDERYLTPSDSLTGTVDTLTRLLMETGIFAIPEAPWFLRAMVAQSKEDGTSSRRMEPNRTLDTGWTRDHIGEFKFGRPATVVGRSEVMLLHVRAGLLESFRIETEARWIDRLTKSAPQSARPILEAHQILSQLVEKHWTWQRFPKNGRYVEDQEVSLGYQNVRKLRKILTDLRAAWTNEVFIDKLTGDGPGSDTVRVRFCVL